jgi:hypothetical protein
MDDTDKTKEQLIDEVTELRQQVAVIGVTCSSMDITKRIKMEEEFQALNEKLQQRTAQTAQQTKELESLTKVRDAIWNMNSSTDIEQVITAVCDSLKTLGVPFKDMAVNLVDDSSVPPIVYASS